MIHVFQLDVLWYYQFSVMFVEILQLLVIESWSQWKTSNLYILCLQVLEKVCFYLIFDEVVNKGK